MKHYDLFVIGAGSGGIASAKAAADKGAKVAISEPSKLGGTCVNRGCVPKKLYSFASHYSEELHNSSFFGWQLQGEPNFNWQTLKDNVATEIERLNGIYEQGLSSRGITIYNSRASLAGEGKIRLEDDSIVRADKILIATGGAPILPPIEGIENAITSDEAFTLESLPEKMVIVGGGYIAVEFACIFNGLGVDVDLLVRGGELLRGFDPDIRSRIEDELKTKGIGVHCGINTNKITGDKTNNQCTVQTDSGKEFKAGQVMFAIGRKPNTEGLYLQEFGVEVDAKGAIKVDEWHRTSASGIYALGDVIDRVNLTPVAITQGRAFAESYFGENTRSVDYSCLPTAIFSHPPIATVGLNEDSAFEKYSDISVYKVNFRPMINTLGDIGEKIFMKMLVDDETDRVVGIHILGKEAPEIIQGFAAAMKAGATKSDLDSTIGIHPSSAEELLTMK
jgi:glutathione reductase (NADPH)